MYKVFSGDWFMCSVALNGRSTCWRPCFRGACPLQLKSVCLIDKCYHLIDCDRLWMPLVRAGMWRSQRRLTFDGLIGFYSALESFPVTQRVLKPHRRTILSHVVYYSFNQNRVSLPSDLLCKREKHTLDTATVWYTVHGQGYVVMRCWYSVSFTDFPYYSERIFAAPRV